MEKLQTIFNQSEEAIVKWMQEKDLLPKTRMCHKPACVKERKKMTVVDRTDVVDMYGWRCSKCGARATLRADTIWKSFKVSFRIILRTIFYWGMQTTQVDQSELLEVCPQTLVTIQQSLRAWVSLDLNLMKMEIGGPGRVVEIDESHFIRVKHNKGKDLKRPAVWVFGMYERTTKVCIFRVVPSRDAKTLLNVIFQHVRSNTVIYSDCWSAYSRVSNLKEFEHQTVNHKYNFVDPGTGTHTNAIESVWNKAKIHLKSMRGVCRSHLQSYLNEFVWRHNHQTRHADAGEMVIGVLAGATPLKDPNDVDEETGIVQETGDETSVVQETGGSENVVELMGALTVEEGPKSKKKKKKKGDDDELDDEPEEYRGELPDTPEEAAILEARIFARASNTGPPKKMSARRRAAAAAISASAVPVLDHAEVREVLAAPTRQPATPGTGTGRRGRKPGSKKRHVTPSRQYELRNRERVESEPVESGTGDSGAADEAETVIEGERESN